MKPPGEDDHRASKEERAGQRQDLIARTTTLGLHIAEDVIYALTALLLVAGALVVLGQAVYKFAIEVPDGVIHSVELTLNSLLIVFILVELLSAVRSAITEHKLIAEPFLLVGMLAAIKEVVVESTFRISTQKPTDVAWRMGVLTAVVLAFALATLIMRRREREPEEHPE
ncbi:MAG: phosphate-starvation-inducible PsiE family protein [Actinomycetota bacterium]|nr:phosphate-starvation-inducible PsiE family protein [Actinomycetota bacterium]